MNRGVNDNTPSLDPGDALKLVLLFHRGGFWTEQDINEWERITGLREATTKTLCDHIRLVLDRYNEINQIMDQTHGC